MSGNIILVQCISSARLECHTVTVDVTGPNPVCTAKLKVYVGGPDAPSCTIKKRFFPLYRGVYIEGFSLKVIIHYTKHAL